MLKIACNDLWVSCKNNWVSLLIHLAFYVIATVVSISILFTFSQFMNSTVTGQTVDQMLQNPEMRSQVVAVLNFITIIFSFLIMRKIPMRLSKGMFVCAAGTKEKLNYLRMQLVIKFLFSSALIFLGLLITIGNFFAGSDLVTNFIQISLWIFVILNINLKVGIGESGARKKDLNGYYIFTKQEEMANTYWPCILMIENIIFYTLVVIHIPNNWLIVVLWGIAILLNIGIAVHITTPIMKKALSFEEVYRQAPAEEVGII